MIECKQAILDSELNMVKTFLESQNLSIDNDVDCTLYLVDDDKIIGTVSKAKSVIKCIAVDDSYKGENLSSILINKIIEKMMEENIYSYQIFTKPIYKKQFESLGFNLIAESDKAIILEKGTSDIYQAIDEMKKIIANNYGKIDSSSNIGAIVMNANPFTLGHQYLVEEACKRHDLVLIFLLSEDKSIFSFEERTSIAYLSTSRFSNCLIIPSSIYMVSKLTFPTYFIKDSNTRDMVAAELDAKIFKDYFQKFLYIKKRYVGSETKNYMVTYNSILKDILGDSLVEIDRIKVDDQIVSASHVRKLFSEGKIEEALTYIPRESHTIVRLLAFNKYAK